MDASRKKPEKSPRLGIAIALLFFAPQLAVPALVIWLIVHVVKTKPTQAPKPTKPALFDDCPQKVFCFHKDKGEHHVRKGREIDPWDRPDIDIRKYQRKN